MVKRWKPAAMLAVTLILAASLQNELFLFLLGFEALLILAAHLQAAWLSKHVRMHILTSSRTAFRGESFQLQAELTNTCALPVPQLMARVSIRVFPEDDALLLRGKTMLGSRETGRLCFTLDSSHCSCLEIWPNQLMITDFLGMVQRRCAVDDNERRLFFVLPECKMNDEALPDDASALVDRDGDEEKRGYTSPDVAEIRAYQPGDPIRLIHWKLSARMEELLVRETSDPAESLTLLYLDLCEQDPQHNIRRDKDAWDSFMETVAGVSSTLLSRELKHTVLWADAAQRQAVTHEVTDEESRQAMLCALLRTDTYTAQDYSPLMKEVASGEATETCIQIDLQGRIARSEAA